MGQLLNRDDFTIEEVQILTELAKEIVPESKMIFAGDIPGELPEEVARIVKDIEEQNDKSFRFGQCRDCSRRMINWPPTDDPEWDIDKDWNYFKDIKTNEIAFFLCDLCSNKH